MNYDTFRYLYLHEDEALQEQFDKVTDKYNLIPPRGEGETLCSQMAVAINRLVYKFYNDGSTCSTALNEKFGGEDESSYSRWLMNYAPDESVRVCAYTLEKLDEEELYEAGLNALMSVAIDYYNAAPESSFKVPAEGTIY